MKAYFCIRQRGRSEVIKILRNEHEKRRVFIYLRMYVPISVVYFLSTTVVVKRPQA